MTSSEAYIPEDVGRYLETGKMMKIVVVIGWILLELVCIILLWKKENKIVWKQKTVTVFVLIVIAGVLAHLVNEHVGNYLDIVKLLVGYLGLSTAALVDFKEKRIPNYIILIMLAVRGILLVLEIVFHANQWGLMVGGCVLSGCLVFGILFILNKFSRDGFGMGDVKLLTALGFLCGIYAVLNTMLMGLIICVLFSMVLIFTKKRKANDKIPFGPFLYIGYVITLLIGAY